MADHPIDILLRARDQASKQIGAVNKQLGLMGRTSKGTSRSLAKIGGAVAGGVAGFVSVRAALGTLQSGLESLAERENVISATEQAIRATGNAAKVSAVDIRTWSEAIETATGAAVDDKAIQAGANALLRFKAVSGDTFKRVLIDAVDIGAALKIGPEAAAKALGKALVDPLKGMTMLKRAGVVLNQQEQDRIAKVYKLTAAERKQLLGMTKAQQKTFLAAKKHRADLRAQAMLLKAVEDRYKGAAAASQGPYTKSLNMLSDAAEDAKMALATGFLPVIERVRDWLTTQLAKPETVANLRSFGEKLAGVFDKAIDFAEKVPWGAIGAGLQKAADWAGKLFDAFRSLPPEAQATIVALAGLNKLSGGAISGVVGELGKGLIKGVLGMTAGVVNIRAGVVNGGGGLPDVGGSRGGGWKAALGNAAKIVGPLAALAAVAEAFSTIPHDERAHPGRATGLDLGSAAFGRGNADTRKESEAGLKAAFATVDWGSLAQKSDQQDSLAAFREGERTSRDGLNDVRASTVMAGTTAAVATGLAATRIVSAISAINFSPQVNVSVTSVNKAQNQQGRSSGGTSRNPGPRGRLPT